MINNVPCNIDNKDELHKYAALIKYDANNMNSSNPITGTITKSPEIAINKKSAGLKNVSTNCSVVLNNIRSSRAKNLQRKKKSVDKKSSQNENDSDHDSDGKLFEFEESDNPLLPLYLLRDEGPVKWVLFSDLAYVLKLKTKDALLKQVSRLHASSQRKDLNLAKFLHFLSPKILALSGFPRQSKCTAQRCHS